MDVLKRSDGWLDLPLSDKGRMGLIPAQQYLKLEPITCIYAPPLRRTQETAHILQSGIIKSPDVEPSPEATTWDLGVLAGMIKEEVKPRVKELLANPSTKPMGGESHGDFKKRYMKWFRKQVRENKDGCILIICSGSNLRLLGLVLFGNRDQFNLDEGGLACLHRDEDGAWHSEVLIGDGADPEEIS